MQTGLRHAPRLPKSEPSKGPVGRPPKTNVKINDTTENVAKALFGMKSETPDQDMLKPKPKAKKD